MRMMMRRRRRMMRMTMMLQVAACGCELSSTSQEALEELLLGIALKPGCYGQTQVACDQLHLFHKRDNQSFLACTAQA